MKLLLLTLLVAATLQLAAADFLAGQYRTMHELNDTNVCFEGVFNHSLLETNTSGWAYNATGCSVADNSYVNISGMELPILYQGVPVIPVGFNFHQNTVGAGSALIVQGPLSTQARMVMPWFIEIIGNTFARDATLRIIGSIPINSSVTIAENSFDVHQSNPFLTDSLDRVVGISIGGNLTTMFEPTSLYHNAHVDIVNNTIVIDAVAADKVGAGIRILSDVYFTDNTSMIITHNKVSATCGNEFECFGFDTSSYMTLPEGYADSYALLDDNSFTVRNGRGFVVPQVWSPNATFFASASRNSVSIILDADARLQMSECAFTFQDNAAGQDTRIDVRDNVVTAIGNSIIFFSGALDLTQNAMINCSGNALFTTTGDPTVYFLNQLSLSDHSTLLINKNRFNRQDNVAVTRPYLSLTYDLAILGYSLFSFSDNNCAPTFTSSGPRLVTLTEGRVANVGPTAFFSICRNYYNGNPADLMAAQLLTTNVRDLVNCNARTEATTTSATTTAVPTTTEALTTVPPPVNNQGSAVPAAVATLCAVAAAALMLVL